LSQKIVEHFRVDGKRRIVSVGHFRERGRG
jgi:hypothetical protein